MSDYQDSSAATTCPLHSSPDAWYDPGCRGCVQARLTMTERSLNAANMQVTRLEVGIREALARVERSGFTCCDLGWMPDYLSELISGRRLDA